MPKKCAKFKLFVKCGRDRYGGIRALDWAWQFFFCKSIAINLTNGNIKIYAQEMRKIHNCSKMWAWQFCTNRTTVGVRV